MKQMEDKPILDFSSGSRQAVGVACCTKVDTKEF